MLEKLAEMALGRYMGVLVKNGHIPVASAAGELALAEDGVHGLWEMYIGAQYYRICNK